MGKTQAFLDANGITQGEIANALGMTQAAVSRKLAGLRNWRLVEVQVVLGWLTTRLGRPVSYDEVFGLDACTTAAGDVVAPSSDPAA